MSAYNVSDILFSEVLYNLNLSIQHRNQLISSHSGWNAIYSLPEKTITKFDELYENTDYIPLDEFKDINCYIPLSNISDDNRKFMRKTVWRNIEKRLKKLETAGIELTRREGVYLIEIVIKGENFMYSVGLNPHFIRFLIKKYSGFIAKR